ncbi:MAG TPA: ribosome-associated translation inhibitor RaiA [Stellaceae bacterium]|nr:ribosome-associated translation inhibitor RaiA [Stellaceae bacterium]
MQLSITGKQTDVGDALRSHVAASLDGILDKYFGAAIEAHVVFSREAHLVRAEIAVHIGRGIMLNARAAAGDHYAAFDAAAEHVGKRLRRYKRRLRDHHKARQAETAEGAQAERAINYVLAPIDDEAEEGAGASSSEGAPVTIAETSTELPHLTVGEAVMRLDLAGTPVLLFRNRAHGKLNVVYRRGDGNIGWIDPVLGAAAPSRGR